jgi:predicted dehydrogenase
MENLHRRRFLTQSGAAAGLFVAAGARLSHGASPSEKLTLAVIGIQGRGGQLAQNFAAREDCTVAYLCDVDESLFDSRAREVFDHQGTRPQLVGDFRRTLDDPAVDAVVIATPDHWHALATIWACQAGKDVYVEKPISHSVWEGRQMVRAARAHDRIVQVGTQNRSAPYIHKAKEYLDSGRLGTVHLVRVYNQKHWPNVELSQESKVPAGLNWDMWLGPAPDRPYNSTYHRYWNHFWDFSGGDIINDAVHQMDIARWLLNLTAPNTVYSAGGRFAEEGVMESPDTQVAVYEFDKLLMTFELTLYTPYMIKSDAVLRNSDMFPYWPQNTERIEIFGTEGLMIVGRMGGGWQVYDRQKNREPVIAAQEHGRFPDPPHQQNFVDCVKSRQTPNADIEEGHLSTVLCQIANISYRLGGRKLVWDAENEAFQNEPEASAALKRTYRDPWRVPEVV